MAAKAEARRGPARRRPCAGRRQERQSLGARLGVPGSTDPLPGDIRRRRSRPPPARGPSPALAQESVMALGPIPCPYRRTVAMWSADPGMPPASGSAAPDGRTDGRSFPLGRAHGSITAGPLPCRTSRRRNSSRLWPSCDGPRPSAGLLPMRKTGPVRRMGAAGDIPPESFFLTFPIFCDILTASIDVTPPASGGPREPGGRAQGWSSVPGQTGNRWSGSMSRAASMASRARSCQAGAPTASVSGRPGSIG